MRLRLEGCAVAVGEYTPEARFDRLLKSPNIPPEPEGLRLILGCSVYERRLALALLTVRVRATGLVGALPFAVASEPNSSLKALGLAELSVLVAVAALGELEAVAAAAASVAPPVEVGEPTEPGPAYAVLALVARARSSTSRLSRAAKFSRAALRGVNGSSVATGSLDVATASPASAGGISFPTVGTSETAVALPAMKGSPSDGTCLAFGSSTVAEADDSLTADSGSSAAVVIAGDSASGVAASSCAAPASGIMSSSSR